MGNRAVIAFENSPSATGIYLHWNGGPESVLAFCKAAKEIGARDPSEDPVYAMAGLCRAVTLFLHSTPAGELTSMGVGPLDSLDCDNYDNGLYIVGKGWRITDRFYERDQGNSHRDVSSLSKDDKKKYYQIVDEIVKRDEACTDGA